MSGRPGSRWADESGTALVVALVVTVIVLMLGLAVIATSQTQLSASATSRVRDSSFQLAEGALYAQGFLLPANWPGSFDRRFPGSCSSAAPSPPSDTSCPDRDTLAAANSADHSLANFSSSDYEAAFGNTCPTTVTAANDVTCWITEIRDDGAPLDHVFKASQANVAQGSCAAPCTWDANGNKQVWAYARAFVHGKARAMAAKLKLETLNEGLASAGFRVGHFRTGNNGNKDILDAGDAPVLVNCDPGLDTCVDARDGQVVSNDGIQQNPDTNNVFMSADQLRRFEATARADGRYYTGCPPNNDLSGKVVWVEDCTTTVPSSAPSVPCTVPKQNGNTNCFNTPDATQTGGCATASCPGMLGGPGPGLLIWHHGTLSLNGDAIYVGTIYMPNGSDEDWAGTSGDTLLTIGGTAGIYGSLAIDGNGGAEIGESKENFQYDPNSAGVFKTYGTAGLVQNTWQELPPSGG